jgi:hypothetical protein
MQERQVVMEETEVGRQVSVQRRQARETKALGNCTLAVISANVVEDQVALVVVEDLRCSRRLFSGAGLRGATAGLAWRFPRGATS